MKQYKRLVIGVDQSYQNVGISVAVDRRLKDVKSIRLDNLTDNTSRRRALAERLSGLLAVVADRSDKIECIIERIRLRSGQQTSFINIDYIKSIGALNALIVDTCSQYNVPVYSVDTRCWKSQVVGTSKPAQNRYGVPPEKWPTVKWCIDQGFEQNIILPVTNARQKNGVFIRNGQRYQYNHDASDSAGIAMFGFIGDRDKLHLER